MREERIDPAPILANLGIARPFHVTPVVGGAGTAIWRVAAGRREFALRLFRPEQVPAVQREVAAMRAAGNAGVPTPRVHAATLWHDREALLLTWMPGRPLGHEIRLQPERAFALGVAFGRAQARIHRIPAPRPLANTPHAWVDLAPPDDALDACLRSAATRAPALLHLDYHPMNVLIDRDQISAVIDWTNARGGDPRADLARTALLLRYAPLLDDDSTCNARRVRRQFHAGWREGYRAMMGAPGEMAALYAWAAASMIDDLSPRVGRPDLPWLTESLLAEVSAWGARWRRRALCRASAADRDGGATVSSAP
jgi:aminoglycoside phosphotransferase (APT) family kinase protein